MNQKKINQSISQSSLMTHWVSNQSFDNDFHHLYSRINNIQSKMNTQNKSITKINHLNNLIHELQTQRMQFPKPLFKKESNLSGRREASCRRDAFIGSGYGYQSRQKMSLQQRIRVALFQYQQSDDLYRMVIGQLQKKDRQLAEYIQKEQFKLNKLSKETEELGCHYNQIRQINATMQHQNAILTNQLRIHKDKANTQVESLNAKLDQLQQEVSTYKQKILLLNKEIHFKDNQIHSQQNQIVRLQQQLLRQTELNNRLTLQIHHKNTTLESENCSARRYQNIITHLEAKNEELIQQLLTIKNSQKITEVQFNLQFPKVLKLIQQKIPNIEQKPCPQLLELVGQNLFNLLNQYNLKIVDMQKSIQKISNTQQIYAKSLFRWIREIFNIVNVVQHVTEILSRHQNNQLPTMIMLLKQDLTHKKIHFQNLQLTCKKQIQFITKKDEIEDLFDKQMQIESITTKQQIKGSSQENMDFYMQILLQATAIQELLIS